MTCAQSSPLAQEGLLLPTLLKKSGRLLGWGMSRTWGHRGSYARALPALAPVRVGSEVHSGSDAFIGSSFLSARCQNLKCWNMGT